MINYRFAPTLVRDPLRGLNIDPWASSCVIAIDAAAHMRELRAEQRIAIEMAIARRGGARAAQDDWTQRMREWDGKGDMPTIAEGLSLLHAPDQVAQWQAQMQPADLDRLADLWRRALTGGIRPDEVDQATAPLVELSSAMLADANARR